MTRSHVLLHCTNARLASARQEAWGEFIQGAFGCYSSTCAGRGVSSISGVGRVMDNAEDEEETRAARMISTPQERESILQRGIIDMQNILRSKVLCPSG
jgi:hypothetical protein